MYLLKANKIRCAFLASAAVIIQVLCLLQSTYAQQADSIRSRVILIGDAGEMDMQQDGVIGHAARQVLTGKTTVFYLGDNIYPRGMGLPGSKEEQETKDIIKSQYTPFRKLAAPVYFIPGNHDWDKSGPLGLAKIQRQDSFLKEQGDSLLSMIPANGCPGPVEIQLSKDLVVIAFDSEWWVYPYAKETAAGTCDCNTKEETIEKFKILLEKNKHKMIVLASHHPFQSYGSHGGYFSLKDHIFPLTALNKNLYVPLPVLGSLYPLLRTTFVNPEDKAHPLYTGMINRIDSVFAGFPNLIHVAGHDHGLQFIKNDQVQVVSGSGAKHSYVRKGKHALYASTLPGYVIIDQLKNNYVRFTYYAQTDGKFEQVFTFVKEFIPGF
ncbi:metallophosphoesterase [Pedobacter metabolipauper]|uniref:Calcineurin-like phosphoesterase family protein n=1 Tax=Pedobacter metabolipauper TaxID=425513 RepID=A0A4R6SY46_9SPHI|nr:metallophosphoesterase [Pedobacter metabolipauper]TDQ11326.1 calcineurin-like phosphoesterase family protein [Pedobacter metabolipauper]